MIARLRRIWPELDLAVRGLLHFEVMKLDAAPGRAVSTKPDCPAHRAESWVVRRA